MPLIQHPVGGTRVPDASRPGEHYEWPHDGAVLDVDPETAAQLAGIAVFREVPPDHPDAPSAPAEEDPDAVTGEGDEQQESSMAFHGGTYHGELVQHDSSFTEAPNEGTPEETPDGDSDGATADDTAAASQHDDTTHAGDEKRPKKASTRKGSRTVRE